MRQRNAPIERFTEALIDHFGSEHEAHLRAGWRGQSGSRCPAHSDDSPSLSFKEGDEGQVLITCQAGCDTADVVRALGLIWKDLFPSKSATPTAKKWQPMRAGRRSR